MDSQKLQHLVSEQPPTKCNGQRHPTSTRNPPNCSQHNISDTSIEENIIKRIFKQYPHLCTRLGRSKNHMAKSTFKGKFTPRQHKGRKVPLHLLERAKIELEKLIEDRQIIRLEKCLDEYFISIDAVANYISERSTEQETFYFSKVLQKYAYSQIPLDPQLQKHCNFNLLGGKATGIYRSLNGFYGLTDLAATFQKTIDVTLGNCHQKFAFLDDILVMTKVTKAEHEKN